MAFTNNPNATATMTVAEPVVVVPAHNVTEYSYGFEGGVDGWSNGTVVSTYKRSGTYSLSADAPARAFTGLVVGHFYSLTAWHSTGGAWTSYVQTFQAAATSMSRTLNVSGTRNWDDVALIHHVPAVVSATASLPLSDGDLTLDSARYPYADARVEVPLTSDALAEQIKPGQRVTLNATSDGAWNSVYTSWTEQRRNTIPNPSFVGWTGWSVRPNFTVSAGGVIDIAASAGNDLMPYQTAAAPASPGEKWTHSLDVAVPAGYTATTLRLAVIPYSSTSESLSPFEYSDTVTVQPGTTHTFQVTHPGLPAGTAGVRLIPYLVDTAKPGRRIIMSRAIQEKRPTAGDFFDGNSTNEELVRTRWTGSANASASVLETRTVERVDWVPAAGVTADLVIRDREISRDGRTISLSLASDESLLDSWAGIADDSTPRTHEASLRNLVNYVLGKAIPGAALQAGTTNANVTAYWQVVNQITNPRLLNNDVGWQTGSGASAGGRVVMSSPLPPIGTTAYRWTASVGESNAVPVTSRYRVTPGKWYVFSAWVCSSTARQARAAIQWWSAGGSVASSTAYGALVTSDVTAFRQVFVIGQCPPGAEEAVPYVSTLGNASGNVHYATNAMLYEGNELVPYFDGSTANTSTYTYEWQADPHNSTSTREPVVDRPPALFTWEAGVTAWDFLAPLVASTGLRLFCDEQRRWWLIDPAKYSVEGRFSARPDNTVQGTDRMDADDDESGYTGVVVVYKWTDADGVSRVVKDAAGVEGKVKVLEFDSPYTGPGVAAGHLAKVKGLGRVQDVTTRTDYTVRPGMEVQITLPGTLPQLGTISRVKWELSNGLMSLGSAQLREMPPGAIDLLTGSIDDLPGTIDGLT